MAEWSIAAVLKTVVPRGTWGSNPYFSAQKAKATPRKRGFLFFVIERKFTFLSETKNKKANCFYFLKAPSGISEQSELIPSLFNARENCEILEETDQRAERANPFLSIPLPL